MNESLQPEPDNSLERLRLETQDLAKRLKQANVQISCLQIAGVLFAGAIIGGGHYLVTNGKLRIEGLSPDVAAKVETRDFGFYNRDGTRVMFDFADRFGNPQITFLDTHKRLRMRLMIFPEGEGTGGLALYDSRGWRGVFRMDGDDSTTFKMAGRDQKGGISMKVTPDGEASLKIMNKEGKVLFEAPPSK